MDQRTCPLDHRTLADLMDTLGHAFNDPGLLVQALTHRSYANEHPDDGLEHNERLEFLGDAVLNLCVGCQLMEMLPDAREGELTRLRAMLVSEDSLAACARRVHLGGYVLVSRGEELSGGRDKPSILADAYEAVVGAVFLDGGFSTANLVLWRLLDPLMTEAVDGSLSRDSKGRLQEVTQARRLESPRYAVVEQRGPDHDRVFVVAVSVGDEELARAEGRSKKIAEQAAARRALRVLEMGEG